MNDVKLYGPQTLEMKLLKDSGVWELKCDCGNIKKYINWLSFKKAYKRDIYKCDSCNQRGRVVSELTKKNMSIAALNRVIVPENERIRRESIRKSLIGHDRYVGESKINWTNKISKSKIGHEVTFETRRKLRIARIKQMEERIFNGNQVHPSYNLKSISIIEQYGKEHGYNFQHAENGGEFYIKELGYWVDGYDREKNTVIEYYEQFHGRQIERDSKRKQEIIQKLECKFIELREK